MTSEPQNDRIVNGLLKADIGLKTPAQVQECLSRDVVIRVDPLRSGYSDLWPCIWFLASILERQFLGRIFISSHLTTPLRSPVPLGPRCLLVHDGFVGDALVVGIGAPVENENAIWGDARDNTISYQSRVDAPLCASPSSCCALAGYLGFAALAQAVGIPPFHRVWAMNSLTLPQVGSPARVPRKIAILGGGQIGQAFLSLNFFVSAGQQMEIHLVDDDCFEEVNYRSQLLLSEDSESWNGKPKVEFLSGVCKGWGWIVTEEKTHIEWGWRNPLGSDSVGFLGFDNMEARRIGVEAGFERLVECGVGTNFLKPRVSWHSLTPDREIAKMLFVESPSAPPSSLQDSEFLRTLDATPGGCGRFTFESIDASAPCLGAIAAAFTWTELLNYSTGQTQIISGGVYAWSPLQPIQRDTLVGNSRVPMV
jgi:hypothetical protein